VVKKDFCKILINKLITHWTHIYSAILVMF
jgi:hypothetical protein